MKLHFSVSEYCINDDNVPQRIADAILYYHILVMNPVREELGAAIKVSKNSGWRPTKHEISKGRSGDSIHTFTKTFRDPMGKGAADYTATDILKLLRLMLEKTSYTRIVYYPNNHFIHADHAFQERGRRYFEAASPSSEWKFIRQIS